MKKEQAKELRKRILKGQYFKIDVIDRTDLNNIFEVKDFFNTNYIDCYLYILLELLKPANRRLNIIEDDFELIATPDLQEKYHFIIYR